VVVPVWIDRKNKMMMMMMKDESAVGAAKFSLILSALYLAVLYKHVLSLFFLLAYSYLLFFACSPFVDLAKSAYSPPSGAEVKKT
jgi:hypothetical protein